jgi:hypothetical protein
VVEYQAKATETQRTLIGAYAQLCPDQTVDDRARTLFKDNICSISRMIFQDNITSIV